MALGFLGFRLPGAWMGCPSDSRLNTRDLAALAPAHIHMSAFGARSCQEAHCFWDQKAAQNEEAAWGPAC